MGWILIRVLIEALMLGTDCKNCFRIGWKSFFMARFLGDHVG